MTAAGYRGNPSAMLSAFVIVALLRAAAAAAVVVSASVLAEAVGPLWGGLIVSLPISAGPAYVMLGLQHDPVFIAAGALGSLTANAVTILYMLAISLLAPRLRWQHCLLVSLSLWFALAWLIRQMDWDLAGVVLANVVVFVVALLIADRVRPSGATIGKAAPRRWFELPIRALLVGGLTASVVTASRWLGPSLTGMAAVFPIATTGLALIVLPRLGGVATAMLFASTLRAMPGFALALLVLHLTAVPLGTWLGMLTALSAQLAFSALLLLLSNREHRSRPAMLDASRRARPT